jgi:small conductance mechanosensitive channel
MDFEALSKLAWLVDREIYYLDKDGKVEAASNTTFDFSAMFDPDSDLAPLLKVLKGQANRIEAGEWKDGEYKSYLAVMRTGSGGIILLERTSEAPFAGEEYYAEYKIPDEYTLFSVDSGTGKILTSSEKRYTGETASSIGLTEDVCKDGFVGDIMLDGRRFLVQAMEVGARVDLIASDLSCLLRQFLPLFLETIAVGVVLALLALYFVWRIQEKTWTCLEKEKGKDEEKLPDEENASFYREQDGNLRSYRGAVGRWLHIATPFRMMSADEKFQVVIHIILSAAIVVVYLFYLKSDTAGIRDNTIAYLMQRTWHFGLNIYAVSYALLMIAIIIVLSLLFRRIIIMMGKYFGNRGETIARLIGSFIRYGAVIFSVLYGLLVLGVNTMAILASAGIIGLGVSIGARDLISDILAGICIVFEGEFRTGDIVEIDGFRGIVEEIGVRTTKVMSLENVKVFRNSNVSGVINLTQRHSIAQVRLEISRKEPIGHVKEVITKELPKIRERIPQAVGEIKLMGIDKLTINTVVLLFETRCKEQDRWTVESMLMWELDVLMEKESGGCV